jgi:molecular chaperone GrpE
VEILQPGYKVGDKILRPARVAVAEPEPDATASSANMDPEREMSAEPPSTSSGQRVEGPEPIEQDQQTNAG